MSACLEPDELVAMIEGTLPPDRVEVVVAHVDGCTSCAEVLATLGRFDVTEVERDAGSLPPARAPLVGRQVGRYLVEGALGEGGMGVVYAAFDPELRRRVAVKLVRPERADDDARARMLREARALARISHPNVVAVHDVGEHDGEVFVATELVEGETLLTWARGRPPAEVIGAWLQAARGLAAAHAQGVIHRDVKPANVLVGRDGRVRIGDFGLAKEGVLDAAAAELVASAGTTSSRSGPGSLGSSTIHTVAGAAPGTPAYMAPEQHAGVADARSDQYSLCVGLVESLTGVRPRVDDPIAVTPPALAAVLARGLSGDPDDRFPTIEALADAIAGATAAPARRRLGPVVAIAAGAAVVAGGAAALVLTTRGSATASCEPPTLPPGLWPDARRAKLLAATAPALVQRVDAKLASWSAMAADVCTTDRAAPAVARVRRACLSGLATKLGERLDQWDRTPPSDALKGVFYLDLVPSAAKCSHAAVAATGEPTSAQRKAYADLGAELDRVVDQAPEPGAAIPKAAEVYARIRALDYAPYTVEAATTLAQVQAATDRAAALATLRDALAVAERARDPFGQVEAIEALVLLLGGPGAEEAALLAEQAQAPIAALGGDPVVAGQLAYALGTAWSGCEETPRALAAYDLAVHEFRRAYGTDDPYVGLAMVGAAGAYFIEDAFSPEGRAAMSAASALFERDGINLPIGGSTTDPANVIAATTAMLERYDSGQDVGLAFQAQHTLANAYLIMEEDAKALEHYRAAIALGERLPKADSNVANAMLQAASLEIERGRVKDALVLARRSVAVAQDLCGRALLAATETVLGRALLANGMVADARAPLEEALAIREKNGARGRARGFTAYLLAQAIVDVDRKRALDLAHGARTSIDQDVRALPTDDPAARHVRAEQIARLAEIDRWLAAQE